MSPSDLGLLALRLTAGGLMAGHGVQKLFGWFGGQGLQGTAGWLESSFGLRPGKQWAIAAGASEAAGGALTALGLLSPLGPVSTLAAMAMAMRAHTGKPIWVTQGGGELPLVYGAIAVASALTGPGRYSLDRALGIRMPWQVTALTLAGAAAITAFGLTRQPAPATEMDETRQEVSAATAVIAGDRAYEQTGTTPTA